MIAWGSEWLCQMKSTYLNDYHRERSERLKERLSKQPKVSLEDAMNQYDRIKRGSSRRKKELPTAERVTS
jgi:hypothetical protein